MWDTFCIFGPSSKPSEVSSGTCFFLCRSVGAVDSDRREVILVTAAHVLEKIEADFATLQLHDRQQNGSWKVVEIALQIRSGGKPKWVHHPDSSIDVAAMSLQVDNSTAEVLKDDIIAIPTTLLATDQQVDEFKIHPGSTLYCLGFPHNASCNEARFPILRIGTIASYPVLPMARYRSFLFDFEVFPGNSGGPVFLAESNPITDKGLVLGKLQMILGLVTDQLVSPAQVELKLASVITAPMIKETIDKLPTEK